ncbi:MAG: YegS/Rv2252/BmrU family lipid kinase [Prevotella sp.]|nr:YegS/Rv2252/BmrU family lipid kinase [Prevotella sp.]MBP5509001.1 YegS/Rv2252/BmrU family lipid kinase [Prevotella sp.]
MKVLFVMNPISGAVKKSGIPKLIDQYIDKDRFEYNIRYTERAGHAETIAREAAEAGIDIVVAVGGDGTINEVGRGLIHTTTALSVIPCGSGNGLARHLSIPVNIKKSISILNKCQIHELDYCTINEHPFFCTCGMGFDAFISQKFATSKRRGPLKYIEEVLREGLNYEPEVYQIEDEGSRHRYQAYLVTCANASQYGNNAYIAPQASMSDGFLDVIIMEPFGFMDAAQVSFDLMNKTLDKSSKVKTFKSKHVIIHRQHPGPVHFDGDPLIMGTDLEVSVIEHGIRVVCNEEAEDASRLEPNAIQNAVSELLNDISDVHSSIRHQRRNMMAFNKRLWRRLNK